MLLLIKIKKTALLREERHGMFLAIPPPQHPGGGESSSYLPDAFAQALSRATRNSCGVIFEVKNCWAVGAR
jgi:hypothetical protein